MQDKIAVLKTPTLEANQSTVEMLDSWLEMAKRGEIVSVAICGVMPSGEAFTELSVTHNQITLLGAAHLLLAKMTRRAFGE